MTKIPEQYQQPNDLDPTLKNLTPDAPASLRPFTPPWPVNKEPFLLVDKTTMELRSCCLVTPEKDGGMETAFRGLTMTFDLRGTHEIEIPIPAQQVRFCPFCGRERTIR